MPHVVVIGGGITGLSTAFYLQRHSTETGKECRITLIEASERLGGKLLTEQVDEFIIDAGADIFMARKPGAMELCHDLGIADQLRETNPVTHKTYVRTDNGLHPVSMYEDEPLVALSSGMQSLAIATANALAATTVRCGIQAVEIERTGEQYDVWVHDTRNPDVATRESIQADAVIITTPAKTTATLLTSLLPSASHFFEGVSYTKTSTVSVAYRVDDVPNALDGYGYIVRNVSEGEVSATTWSSSKIAGRAPRGFVLIRAFIRGIDTPTEATHALVTQELRQSLGITASPVLIRSFGWPEAVPMYGSDHADRIANLEEQLQAFPGINIVGSAIGAPGIPDSIRTAHEAATAAWTYITTRQPPTRTMHREAIAVTQSPSFFARS